jgi:hypothetical protein
MNQVRPAARRLSISVALAVMIGSFSATQAAAECYLIIRTCVTTQTYLFGFIPLEPQTECTTRREGCPYG